MALEGWFKEWFASGYYPSVWFAPADETGVNPEELRPSFIAEVEIKINRPRKWYVRKKKQLFLFNTAEEADAFQEASELADKAIEEAQRTSRRARKRLRERVYKVSGVQPESIQIDFLSNLADRFAINVDLPALIAQQDFERVMEIHALAMQMLDEEDIELLLLYQ